jgi:hypothetical protein
MKLWTLLRSIWTPIQMYLYCSYISLLPFMKKAAVYEQWFSYRSVILLRGRLTSLITRAELWSSFSAFSDSSKALTASFYKRRNKHKIIGLITFKWYKWYNRDCMINLSSIRHNTNRWYLSSSTSSTSTSGWLLQLQALASQLTLCCDLCH